jgi:Ca-activated chloride channel family protein
MWSKLFDISIFEYEYTHKSVFWLMLIIPFILIWYFYNQKRNSNSINITTLENFEKKKINWFQIFKHTNFGLLIIAIALIISALAKPQDPNDIEDYKNKNIEGIDVVIALDVSGSMRADDFKPNRLESAKETAIEFINQRPNDRIGLVVYGTEAYTQAPLTHDHDLLKKLIQDIRFGILEDRTAIGSGLVTSVNRLVESESKSKVIILLSDGENTAGKTSPVEAAEIAAEFDITIYTIGIGKKNAGFFGVSNSVDENTLTEIATIGNGKYFRAQNKKELSNIYEEIDLMEKSKVKTLEYKMDPPEKYYGLLAWAILLILFSQTMNITILKSIN